MKKLFVITGLLIGMAWLAAGVQAQDNKAAGKTSTVQTTQETKTVCKFVDKNGDGKCDNCAGDKKCCPSTCCGKDRAKSTCQGTTKDNCCGEGTKAEPGKDANATPLPEKK